jgi:regulator of RNase E activity RraA
MDSLLLDAIRRDLFTAVVGDVLDQMGYLHQFLPPYLQPLRDDMVLIGRAMTVQHRDLSDLSQEESQSPFGLMLEALDDIKPGEVYVATGSSPSYALIGEHMSTRAKRLGAVGAVIDGYSRDTRGILDMNFPLFSRGRYAQDQRPRGRVVAYRVPVTIGAVQITPGDIIFADLDGVLVVPQAVEEEAFRESFARVRKEHAVHEALEREGSSAAEAMEKFGIL